MLPAGEIADKYELIGKLDEGGMGEIYKVRHRLLDEVRVIKLIRHQKSDDPELQQRFLREARTAIQLRHPNIAEIFDFSIDPQGVACIVMEFIDGLDIKQMIQGGVPPVPLALEIASQALRALGFLHHRGFIHRDISPDNLMLTSDHDGQPLVKLIDLGIAKRLSGEAKALTATGMFVGKMQYAAPEQFERDVQNSPRSDLYAFGVLLYELLTARCPIVGANLTELITAHVLYPPLSFDESDPEGRVCAGLREAVLRALEKKPENRHADAESFAAALAPFREGDDLAADLETTLALDIDRLEIADEARSQVTELLAEARLLVGRQQFDAAREVLDRALGLDPDRTETRRLLATVDDMLQLRAEAELSGQITSTAQAIDQLIRDGRLDDAERQLDEAVGQLGEATLFHELKVQLGDARRTLRRHELARRLTAIERRLDADELDVAEQLLSVARDLFPDADELAEPEERLSSRRETLAAIDRACEAAREQLEAGDPDAAAEAAQEALELASDSSEASALLDEARQAIEDRQAQAQHAREVADARGTIEGLLEKDALHDARMALDLAIRQLGTGPVWETLGRRLRRAEAVARQRQIDAAVAEARQCLDSDRDTEARRHLDDAFALVGDHGSASQVLAELTSRRAAREQQERLTQAVEAVDAAIEAGDLDRARDALDQVDGTDTEALAASRERLEALETEQRASRAHGVRELEIEARALLAAGETDQAKDLLGIVVELDPDHGEARRLLDELSG